MELRVWVGCLAHYNNGELVGAWVDAAEAGEWVCPKRNPNDIFLNCEEYWCMDHEIPWVSGELSPMTAVEWAKAVEWVEDHEEDAFKAWMSMETRTPDEVTEERFRDAYQGEFESIDAYAWHMLDECYSEGEYKVPPGFHMEVDTVAWEQDYTYVNGFIFSTH